MDWDPYTVFSVLSGITLVIVGIVASTTTKDRALWVGGGVALLVYGVYVAAQTSGTWRFPGIIFLIPFGGIGYLLYKRWEQSRPAARPASRTASTTGSGSVSTSSRPAAAAGVVSFRPVLVDEVVEVRASRAAVLEALREGVPAQPSAPILVGGLWRRDDRPQGPAWAWGNRDDPAQIVLEVSLSEDGPSTRCRLQTRGTAKVPKARQDIEKARLAILAILRRLDPAGPAQDQASDAPAAST